MMSSMKNSNHTLSIEEIPPHDNRIDPLTLSTVRRQVGGSHYQLAIEPIDYIVKNNLGYREGNVIKYVSRHKNKNGAEDIKKAIHYLEMILEEYENV